MHVCMHIGACVPMHNPIQTNEEFVFFFIQLVKQWKRYQEFPYSDEDLSFSISQPLGEKMFLYLPLSRQKSPSLALHFLELWLGQLRLEIF